MNNTETPYKYHVAYLTSFDPNDRKSLSGVFYFQSRAIQKYIGNVTYLGPVKPLMAMILRKFFELLYNRNGTKYKTSHSIYISKIFGNAFRKKIKNNSYDIIFADKASTEIAHLNSTIPVVYSTDATFKGLNEYYHTYSNLMKFSAKEGNQIEDCEPITVEYSTEKSAIVICASSWAAASVIKDYGASPEKVYIIPRGANLDDVPDIQKIHEKTKGDVCKLIFVGKDYKRKGFDIAYKTMDILRSKKLPVKLYAIGCNPTEYSHDKDVEIMNFINKNDPEGRKKMDEILLGGSFLIIPTRAEAQGIVFCEASAYGLPSIATNTGGVSEVVKNGINGYVLPFEAGAEDYANLIFAIFNDDKRYSELVISSRNFFETRLNWDSWAKSFNKILDLYFASYQHQQQFKL